MFPVVIPVAGLGTRSLPASKAIPKEMLPLLDKPIIQYVVEEAKAAGVRDVIFVTSSGKSAIEDHFDVSADLEKTLESRNKTELLNKIKDVSSLVNVHSVRQKEALGLGHAVGMAEAMISSSHFFVMLGDEVTDAKPTALEQLLHIYEGVQSKAPEAGVIMLMEVPKKDVSKYGICELASDSSNQILSCVEKPKPEETNSCWAITGRYLLPKKIFKMIGSSGAGALGEIQLTDALQALAKEGNLYACKFQGKRMDAGDRMGFLEANLHYYLRSDLAEQTRNLLREVLK